MHVYIDMHTGTRTHKLTCTQAPARIHWHAHRHPHVYTDMHRHPHAQTDMHTGTRTHTLTCTQAPAYTSIVIDHTELNLQLPETVNKQEIEAEEDSKQRGVEIMAGLLPRKRKCLQIWFEEVQRGSRLCTLASSWGLEVEEDSSAEWKKWQGYRFWRGNALRLDSKRSREAHVCAHSLHLPVVSSKPAIALGFWTKRAFLRACVCECVRVCAYVVVCCY